MSRKPKKQHNVEVVVQDTPIETVFADEPSLEHVKTVYSVNVDELKVLLYKNDLKAMQEAVAKIKGDELTMRAVKSVIEANGSGLASQFLQQIIQRNS